jgi:hypothetical protein
MDLIKARIEVMRDVKTRKKAEAPDEYICQSIENSFPCNRNCFSD